MLGDLLNEKVYWTKRMDLKLVKFLEAKRHVWDPKDPQYSSSRLKDKAYTEFANKTSYGLTSRAIKERWNNIRSTFSNNLRKVEQSQKDDNPFTPCWHLWGPCEFLLEAKNYQKGDKSDSLNIKMEPTSDDELLSWQLLAEKPKSSDDEDDDDKPLKASGAIALDCKTLVSGLVSAFNQVRNGFVQEDFSNPNDKIGRMVAQGLSTLDSLDAAKASCEIMNILLLYSKSNPDNPNNNITIGKEVKTFED